MKFIPILFCIIFSNTVFSQDFQSFSEVRKLLFTDLANLDDTLSNKGFAFDKVDGLVMKYKKNANRLEFLATPKELTYTFTERGFFLKINSEISAQNYQLVNGEELIIVKDKPIKAAYLKKDGEKIYMWSLVDAASNKTMFSLKIQIDLSVTKADETPNNEVKKPTNMPGLVFKNPSYKKPESSPKDSSRIYPKPSRTYITVGGFKFVDPTYGSSGCPYIHIGYQKSNFAKKLPKNLNVLDKGGSIDFSFFSGMDYGWRSDPTNPNSSFTEYMTLRKFYVTLNQYIVYNLKVAEFKFSGGTFLNYNQGIAEKAATTVGFTTVGWHLAEYIQIGFGNKQKGYSKRTIGFGFDQYFAIKGGYIGNFGIALGF